MRYTRGLPWPQRLLDNIDRSGGPDACWPWLGPRNTRDYGRITVQDGDFRRGSLAHREALILAKGQPPTNEHAACHTCNNPPCCNPKHLYWDTAEGNINYAAVQGRMNVPHTLNQYGAKNPNARLTDEIVRDIRIAYRTGETQASIARRFGVRPMQVNRIVHRSQWPHVPD